MKTRWDRVALDDGPPEKWFDDSDDIESNTRPNIGHNERRNNCDNICLNLNNGNLIVIENRKV